MPGILLPLRGSRRRLLRCASLAVLAMQWAVALSPLAEPHSEGRMSAHAEQDGTRHVNLHNEATCVLCSARAQSSMPAALADTLASTRPRVVAARVTHAALSRDDAPTNRSRAPPRLPA